MKQKIFAAAIIIAAGLTLGVLPAHAADAHKNGELINQNGTIYLIQNNQRMGFAQWGEFLSWGYQPEQILPATDGDAALPAGGLITARYASLVQNTGDGQYYIIYDDGAHLLGDSGAAFLSGMSNHALFHFDVSKYPKATAGDFILNYAPAKRGTLLYSNGAFFLVTAQGKAPFPSWAVFTSYNYNINDAKLVNIFDTGIPNAPVINYRDGTLVNDNGTIYLLSGQTRYGFGSYAAFASRGYKLKMVIPGSSAGFSNGPIFN